MTHYMTHPECKELFITCVCGHIVSPQAPADYIALQSLLKCPCWYDEIIKNIWDKVVCL